MPKTDGPRDVVDAVDAVREPLLVAQHEEHERGEGERDEGQEMVLHAQRGIAEAPAETKAIAPALKNART